MGTPLKLFVSAGPAVLSALALATATMTGCSQQSTVPLAVYESHSERLAASGVSGADLLDADRETRVAVVTQLKSAILNRYANLELKNQRIKTADGKPFDSAAHMDRCIETEAKTTDVSDIHFMDRMKLCIAGFQDTHFAAGARVPMATVSTGFLVRNIGGKYFISAVQKDILKYVDEVSSVPDLEKIFEIGNEVLEVDGESPAKLAERYTPYIAASSPGYAQSRADIAIFSRNFDYPTTRSVRLKIKSTKKTYDLEMPWWASSSARNRLDTAAYFQKIGIPITDRVKMYLDREDKVDWKSISLNFKGYLDSNPLFADMYRPLAEFKANDKDIAARMGTISNSGHTFCYAQFLTFSVPLLVAPDGTKIKFIDGVRKFVKSCKVAKLDLVIDLRSNGGGNGTFPAQILSLVTPKGTTLGNKVVSFRANAGTARLMSNMIKNPEIAAIDLGDYDNRLLSELDSAAKSGFTMTNAIPEKAGTTADTEVDGYDGKIVALVTPNCVSACEGLAALLKRTGRATILGTHTSGTGAGFVASEQLDSGFVDTFDALSIRIPNYQWGYTAKPYVNFTSIPYATVRDEYFLENIPTIADTTVEPTLEDITGKKNTWLEATVKSLFPSATLVSETTTAAATPETDPETAAGVDAKLPF